MRQAITITDIRILSATNRSIATISNMRGGHTRANTAIHLHTLTHTQANKN